MIPRTTLLKRWFLGKGRSNRNRSKIVTPTLAVALVLPLAVALVPLAVALVALALALVPLAVALALTLQLGKLVLHPHDRHHAPVKVIPGSLQVLGDLAHRLFGIMRFFEKEE